jgi:hypothetical protein
MDPYEPTARRRLIMLLLARGEIGSGRTDRERRDGATEEHEREADAGRDRRESTHRAA